MSGGFSGGLRPVDDAEARNPNGARRNLLHAAQPPPIVVADALEQNWAMGVFVQGFLALDFEWCHRAACVSGCSNPRPRLDG